LILITGGSGRLGKALVKTFPTAYTPSHSELDVTDRELVFKIVERLRPDSVIHAAALTSVRLCESDRVRAWKTNVEGTANLVDACVKFAPQAYFVYVSTACVFDGEKGNYTEQDIPYPKNFYSLTKLLGESIARRLRHLIVRTNFVAGGRWPYEAAFVDRFGTYLYADDVARGIKDLMDAGMQGVVHLTGQETMSMYEVARRTTPDVKPTSLKEYSGPPLTKDMTLESTRWRKYRMSREFNVFS